MVTKEILKQYVDIQKEIEEIKEKIQKIEKQIEKMQKETVIDSVKGGYGGIQHFRIEGIAYPDYTQKITLLAKRKATLNSLELQLLEILNDIERFINTLDDSRMRRIINLRFIEGLSWNEVANQIGGGNTEDSIRKAFTRFMDKQ